MDASAQLDLLELITELSDIVERLVGHADMAEIRKHIKLTRKRVIQSLE